MQERVAGYFRGIYNRWVELERAQKVRIIAIAAVLLVVIGLSVYLFTRPRMVVLTSGQDAISVSEIQNALTDAGIQSNPTNNATAVEVRQKDFSAAKIALAVSGVPRNQSGKFTYQDALNASGMGTTEAVKINNFKRVKESDLAESLTLFDGVQQATVQLVIPETDNYFIKSDKTSSAGVVLTLNKQMEKSQATAIARYISMSVEGLAMENIEILDQDSNTLYTGMDNFTNGTPTSEYDLEMLRKAEIEAKIKSMLAPMYNEVRPMVTLKLNWDKVQTTDKTVTSPIADSPTGLITKETSENRTVTNAEPADEPGLMANDQATATYEMQQGAESSASEKNRATEYAHNESISEIQASVGDIDTEQSAFSVILYEYKRYEEGYMTDNDLLDGMSWLAFKDAHQFDKIPLEIDPALITSLETATGITKASVIGYEVPVFYDKEVKPLKIEQIVMFAILALLILFLAYGLIKNTQPDEVTEVEPELSVEDLLVSTQLEEQREAIEAKISEVEFGKESEVKRQIEKFVTERPEAVAQLLRNWLNDEWE